MQVHVVVHEAIGTASANSVESESARIAQKALRELILFKSEYIKTLDWNASIRLDVER